MSVTSGEATRGESIAIARQSVLRAAEALQPDADDHAIGHAIAELDSALIWLRGALP